MNDYEAKQAARKERYLERAEKADEKSNAAYGQWKRSAEMIPLGQPILVGHHSEKGHRAHLKRLDRMMQRTSEEADKAKHYRGKAASVGTGGISSDDPDAVVKLKEELATLEKVQARMKTANKLIRQFREPIAAGNKEGYLLAMEAEGFARPKAERLLEPDFCGRIGFPDYALTNNSGNIRRIKQRIEQLAQSAQAEAVTVEAATYTYREDTTENRVMFEFPSIPSEEIRTLLKRNGFKWSPTRGAWVRLLNNAGRATAVYVRSKLDTLTP